MTVQYPIKGKLNKQFKITSPFGTRVHPITGKKTTHYGVDLVMVSGSADEPIRAPEDSRVLEARKSTAVGGGYGYYVKLRGLETGTEHILAHMDKGSLAVKAGDTIKANTVVGNIGTTGASTGVHVHWETRVKGKAVDPIDWIEAHSSAPVAPPATEAPKAWVVRTGTNATARFKGYPVGTQVRVRHNGKVVYTRTTKTADEVPTNTLPLVPGKNRVVLEVNGLEVKGVTYSV